jgi:PAS domain S-box-containing protein
MHKELRDKIRRATEESGIEKPDFLELLHLIDQHYDKMEATITQSLTTTTPMEAIFDSVTDALFTVSESGIVCNCNKVCAHYFGLARDQLIGSKIEHVLPAMKGQTVEEFLQPFLSDLDESQVSVEGGQVKAIRASGEVFLAEISASRLQAGQGHIFVISLRDVTGRQAAEDALKQNEERYRALIENAPEAIVVFDIAEGRFVDANDQACELFNLSRKRLLSVGPESVSPENQPDGTPSFGIARGYIERALAGEHMQFEWMHQDSAGTEIPCEVRLTRLPDGDRYLIRASITNIGERKKNEMLAFAQNKILEMIAASVPHERTLRTICRTVEKIDDKFRAAIMQLGPRNQTLSVVEAPSLPEPFKLLLDFIEVGDNSITCGAAVQRAQDHFTADVANDAAWESQRKQAMAHEIAAAWSFLVKGAKGRVIGTMDVYVSEPRAPSTDELDKLSRLARLAGIAIKRQLDEDRLRSSEMRYRGLFENVVDGVYIAARDGELIAANPALVEMLGYESAEELKAAGRTTLSMSIPSTASAFSRGLRPRVT